MAKYVICPYCNLRFDRDKEEYQVVGRRYAHIKCFEEAEKNKSKEEKDKEELEKYIMKLLNETKINPRVRKQLKSYIEEENYTYSGILKALVYHYEVKNGDVSKANGGIGIVPYVYKDAYNYYYDLFLAQSRNQTKDIATFTSKIKEITIKAPEIKIKKKFFNLDDEKEVENE